MVLFAMFSKLLAVIRGNDDDGLVPESTFFEAFEEVRHGLVRFVHEFGITLLIRPARMWVVEMRPLVPPLSFCRINLLQRVLDNAHGGGRLSKARPVVFIR